MSDSIRRLLERQEALRRLADPFRNLPRQFDALGEAYKQLGVGLEKTRFLQAEEGRRKLLSVTIGNYRDRAGLDVDAIDRIGKEAERQRKLLEGPIEEARRIGLLDPNSDLRRAMATAIEAQQTYERMFRLPEIDEIGRLAREAVGLSKLGASVFGRDRHGGAALEAAMRAVRSPWLKLEHIDRSARAFADIQAMGRLLGEWPPFDTALASSLRPSLGDWRDLLNPVSDDLANPMLRSGFYVERGFDPALTDFTILAFEQSVDTAGLREPRDEPPGSHTNDDEEDGFARARHAFDQLQRFEIAIRRFIEKVMQAAYGETWMERQLPNGILDAWRTKRDTAVKTGEAERPLIAYADFTDYRQIIERSDNWKVVFKPIFGRPEDVRESFQRLFPVRIATMHARIVTLDDELLLLVETKRVLRAIRKAGGQDT